MTEPDFKKGEGLVPAVVQDHETGEILMLAYMNRSPGKKPSKRGRPTSGAAPGRASG